MLMTPPPVRPTSAEYKLVCTRISWIASSDGLTPIVPMYRSLLSIPSIVGPRAAGDGVVGARIRARHQLHEIDEIASDDGEVLDGFLRNKCAHGRRIGLEERGLSRDLHGLVDGSDAQLCIDARAVAAR